MRIDERRLRGIIREELFGIGKPKAKPEGAGAAVKAALDAFMKALGPALTTAYPRAKDKVGPSLENMRSQLEQMLKDTARYLAAQG